MLALGLSRPDVAARLGVTAAVVRKSSVATPEPAKDSTEESVDTDATNEAVNELADNAA